MAISLFNVLLLQAYVFLRTQVNANLCPKWTTHSAAAVHTPEYLKYYNNTILPLMRKIQSLTGQYQVCVFVSPLAACVRVHVRVRARARVRVRVRARVRARVHANARVLCARAH